MTKSVPKKEDPGLPRVKSVSFRWPWTHRNSEFTYLGEYWVTPANQPPYDHYIDFSHASAWTYLAEGNCSANDVLGLIVRDGYEAVSENPTCEIYADISKRVPDAKVILMGRDSKEKFETSWKTWFDTIQRSFSDGHFLLPFGWISIVFPQLKNKIRYHIEHWDYSFAIGSRSSNT